MVSSLVIALREGLEAALIVGMLLAYLKRLGRDDRAPGVWLGTGLAVLASLAAGAALLVTVGELQGIAEQIFEGSAMLLAVGVLPVALLGLVSYTVARDELQRTVGRMQTQAAEDLALFTERTVTSSLDNLNLSTAALLPLDEFSRSELSQILEIP